MTVIVQFRDYQAKTTQCDPKHYEEPAQIITLPVVRIERSAQPEDGLGTFTPRRTRRRRRPTDE